MTPQSVEQARAAFRERHITEHHSGLPHLVTTVGISLLMALLSAIILEKVSPLEWLTIPLIFLYANLSEYLGHKGPMHHKTRFLGQIFERHTIAHHAFFTDEAAAFDTSQDFKAILYFLNYELLHFAYHMDPQSWVSRKKLLLKVNARSRAVF
jgi:hypothetical protein